MYYAREAGDGWEVVFAHPSGKDVVAGPAPSKSCAFKIASMLNGGDMELVQNTEWEFFLDEQKPEEKPPLVYDMAADNEAQLRT